MFYDLASLQVREEPGFVRVIAHATDQPQAAYALAYLLDDMATRWQESAQARLIAETMALQKEA